MKSCGLKFTISLNSDDTMTTYKCFKCEKKISSTNLEKRFVCPHCGSKIFYKPRTKVKKIKAE